MNGMHFTILSLLTSAKQNENIDRACFGLKITHLNAEDKMELLENLLDNKVDLLIFHAEVGEDEILNLLDTLQNDTLLQKLPVILLSDLDNNEALAEKLSPYPVISIFAYDNWTYQIKSLFEFLQYQMHKTESLHSDLENSQEKTFLDPLTGALNRRGSERKFENLVGHYASNKEDFTLIMLDIDFFKKVNDTYGHDIGDEILVSISSIIKHAIRKDDALIRFGGEEFIVFLSNAALDIGINKAESLRNKIETSQFSKHELSITASFGLVAYKGGTSLDKMVQEADTLLYKAKANGRNQVQFA